MSSERQFIEVTLHLRANDEDGYGIAKVAVPADAIRWEGVPRDYLTIRDVFQIDAAVTQSVEDQGLVKKDLDC